MSGFVRLCRPRTDLDLSRLLRRHLLQAVDCHDARSDRARFGLSSDRGSGATGLLPQLPVSSLPELITPFILPCAGEVGAR